MRADPKVWLRPKKKVDSVRNTDCNNTINNLFAGILHSGNLIPLHPVHGPGSSQVHQKGEFLWRFLISTSYIKNLIYSSAKINIKYRYYLQKLFIF